MANLAASLGARFGATRALPALSSQRLERAIERANRVVLLLFDGLGQAQIERLLPNSSLARSRAATLESIFPSSTAPAVASLATGLSPGQHAVTGWHLWWPDEQALVRPLPLDYRGREGVIDPHHLFGWRPLSVSLSQSMAVFQPSNIANSVFSRYAFDRASRTAYSSLVQLRASIRNAIHAAPDTYRYVYAYLPHFDSAAHEFGCESDEAARIAQGLNDFFERVASDLEHDDVLVLATADHGFIDVAPSSLLRLEDYPEIATHLEHPLSGEPRVTFCHVKPGREAEFAVAVRQALGHAFECVESTSLLDAGWFGSPLDSNPRLRSRIGSFTLIARQDFCITQTLNGEKPAQFKGMHGGIHEDERLVSVAARYRGRALALADQDDAATNPVREH